MSQATQHASILIGDIAPDFEAETTQGKISFHEWVGDSWCILFSHPKDFTPVCTTELGKVAALKQQFEKRNVKPISISIDTLDSHKKWIKDIDETQHTHVNYPLIADPERHIAALYGMIHPSASENATIRSVFIIDPKKKVRLSINYPQSTGRNFEEILRVIDSMQLTDHHSVATPADWKPGQDCIILPSITDPKIMKEKFPKGWKEIKPYLRTAPQPNQQ